MDHHQLKRFSKLDYESFFLLKVEKTDSLFTLSISGSTKNIYKVKIYCNSKTMYCNCPDSKSWARDLNVYCKHSCFVLFRVFKTIFKDKAKICNEKVFNEEQFSIMKEKLTNMSAVGLINYSNTDIVDEELLEKFQNMEKNNFKSEKSEAFKVKKKDEMCPICFVDFSDEENEELIGCPDCKNTLHKECMEKWLSIGNTTCVYCRSDVWKDYNNNKSADGGYFCLN
jgi:hypothetical protein